MAKQITNYRWAVSAFGTASTAALDRRDTVYCLTPLHHESALLVSLGGAVVGGTRIALSRGLDRDRFVQEVRQYGVTVVSYTWAMLREIVDDPAFVLHGNHPVRLFIGSGMPTGLWGRVVEAFAPAHVVEFFATTDGQAVLANVSGAKVGSKGRPLPGAGRIELGAYDTEHDLILENDRGFVQIAEPHQVGVLLAASNGPIDPSASVKRGVFAAGDTWISTEYLFYRDDDGDYWLAGRRGSVVHTPRGVVYAEPVTDALGCINGVDLAVTYNVPVGGHEVAVSAVTLLPGASITAADLTEACAKIPIGLGPDIVCVVPEMNLSATYRPTISALRSRRDPEGGTPGLVFRRRIRAVPPADARRARRAERRPVMIDEALLNILVCPADRGPLVLVGQELLYNPRLRRAYRIEDGIPVLLIGEARDVDDEEHARLMAQGRPADPR